MPYLRHSSPADNPAACSFSTLMICSSVNLLLRMSVSLGNGLYPKTGAFKGSRSVLQKKLLGEQIFWHLPEYNKTLLGSALDKIDEKDRFDVPFKCLSSNSSSLTYMTDIHEVFVTHHWKMSGDCVCANVKPDLLGVWLSVNKEITRIEDLPPNA